VGSKALYFAHVIFLKPKLMDEDQPDGPVIFMLSVVAPAELQKNPQNFSLPSPIFYRGGESAKY